MTTSLGDHLQFSSGKALPRGHPTGRFRVYGANGPIGYAAQRNASGPLIVLGRVGTHCGSVYYCDSDVWVTDNALVCRANDAHETRYWYYALRACRLGELRSGSGQPLLNQSILRGVAAPRVSPSERRRVAELLGSLDDKIVANQRVIAAAEALMVATAETVSECVPLSTLANTSTASLGPGGFDDVVAHFSLPAFDDGATPRVVPGATVRSGKFVLAGPCVLVAKLNPRIPRIWNVARLPTEMALASTEFVVLTPAVVDASALWSAVRQPEVSERLRRRVAGTTGSHQRVRPGDLMATRVRDVRRLSGEASRTISDLGALCHGRRAECVRLAALRDALLPLLLSGEVRVRDAEASGTL
ncbi:type I restriction/modification system specificity determinant HsdS [Mycobacterium saskatchewanense]|uniref:Restriction endonuclease subunit S n=1 Tax=Mycobacterium saskatchewanense TaxID=220927 RepID=A0AAJ3NM63_9MYCO|nr:restriction endonuclease subunit S [Mycobacterium saskatchewanense]ORW68167.1 restriction endonuclease subunit S [Mycobacterium saskatchewanense]BBX66370.1 type I restriction/modification system specificity determinant HsdS [Mycobacterium saskatchewanense]